MSHCLVPFLPISWPVFDIPACLALFLLSPVFKLFGVKCTSPAPLLAQSPYDCSEAGMCFCDPYAPTESVCKAVDLLTCSLSSVKISCPTFPRSPSTFLLTSVLLTCTFPPPYFCLFSCAAGNLIRQGVSWQRFLRVRD